MDDRRELAGDSDEELDVVESQAGDVVGGHNEDAPWPATRCDRHGDLGHGSVGESEPVGISKAGERWPLIGQGPLRGPRTRRAIDGMAVRRVGRVRRRRSARLRKLDEAISGSFRP